jgi:hypothetical protein
LRHGLLEHWIGVVEEEGRLAGLHADQLGLRRDLKASSPSG